MNETPKTQWAKSGDIHVAYQVTGRGPLDLVFVPGFVSHLEYQWEEPRGARFFEGLASFSRLICFDKRGTGLSDRVGPMPTLEERMDDVRAVMDAAGSRRAAIFGVSEGGPMSILFAATYPERTAALIICASFARRAWAPDYPFGRSKKEFQARLETFERDWGGPVGIEGFAASLASDEGFRQWWATTLRLGASPGAATAFMRMAHEIDVRHVLPMVQVPTLILHRVDDAGTSIEHARYMAARIPGAKLVEQPGVDHIPWVGNADAVLDEVEEFLTGARHDPVLDRILATVMFTDIVRASEKAVELGDRHWTHLLERHHALVRQALLRFRGKEVDTAGDGFLATFDGPARAVHCAQAIGDAGRPLGLEIRAGLHTGECELVGSKIGGIAVHIGARIAAMANGGEVLVSNTVKDLVVGSGIRFQDRGRRALKGIPGEWQLFAVER